MNAKGKPTKAGASDLSEEELVEVQGGRSTHTPDKRLVVSAPKTTNDIQDTQNDISYLES